jgi:hypothetical protein
MTFRRTAKPRHGRWISLLLLGLAALFYVLEWRKGGVGLGFLAYVFDSFYWVSEISSDRSANEDLSPEDARRGVLALPTIHRR